MFSKGDVMKKFLPVIALAACASILSAPAPATTFPTLTTIYIGIVRDNDAPANQGVATSFNCSNVSGVSASVRFLVLGHNGGVEASTTTTIPHGGTRSASTHPELTFLEDIDLAPGGIGQGVINIESTQSGVFCNAMITEGGVGGSGITLPLVRVNPHPGTVE